VRLAVEERLRPTTRRMAVGFMVGSFLFALGTIPPYASAVGTQADSVTFFLGSLFFTYAGYLQVILSLNAEPARPWRHLGLQLRSVDWWAAAIQSIGTLFFNLSTFGALLSRLSAPQQRRIVWAPDMWGSIAFMIASSLAFYAVHRGPTPSRRGSASWWIASLNLAGSVAFQISAIAAFTDPQTGEILSLPLANFGTFLGAVGFFVAAWISLPAREARQRSEVA
jgi:hypothetical protein